MWQPNPRSSPLWTALGDPIVLPHTSIALTPMEKPDATVTVGRTKLLDIAKNLLKVAMAPAGSKLTIAGRTGGTIVFVVADE